MARAADILTSVRAPARRRVVHLAPDGTVLTGAPAPGAIPFWPFTQDRRAPFRLGLERLLDPINLVVAGAGPREVVAALAAAGWRRPRIASTHRTWIAGALVRMESDMILGDEGERFHVRVWGAGRCTLAAAHHESGGVVVRHVVRSWDAARAQVARDLAGEGFALAEASTPVGGPRHRELPTDGRLWRLAAPGRAYAEREPAIAGAQDAAVAAG
jgi:hypothetical protein